MALSVREGVKWAKKPSSSRVIQLRPALRSDVVVVALSDYQNLENFIV